MVQRHDQKTIAGSRKPDQKWGEAESASLSFESSQPADLHLDQGWDQAPALQGQSHGCALVAVGLSVLGHSLFGNF